MPSLAVAHRFACGRNGFSVCDVNVLFLHHTGTEGAGLGMARSALVAISREGEVVVRHLRPVTPSTYALMRVVIACGIGGEGVIGIQLVIAELTCGEALRGAAVGVLSCVGVVHICLDVAH